MRKSLRRTGFVLAVLLLPTWGWASDVAPAVGDIFIDDTFTSTYVEYSFSQKRQDDKRPKRVDRKRPDQKPDTRRPSGKATGKKPEIKEVPKSIPKLKPKSVTERVRIKRPPVKVKPKGAFKII